jgi:hypothetical protein
LFIRVRRICSRFHDYLFFASLLVIQLVKRGYNFKSVNQIARRIGNRKRKELLPYKDKIKNDTDNKVLAFFKYNNNVREIKKNFVSSFEDLKINHESVQDKKLFFVNNVDNNIGSVLIHNHRIDNSKYKYTKCLNDKCKICKYSTNSYFINMNNFKLPILSNCTCESSNIVYIIECKYCCKYYIGESSRKATDRIREHKNGIKRFRKNININIAKLDEFNETAIHFNLSGHVLEKHFRFYIFKDKLIDINRKSTETDLLNIFIKLSVPILNKKINNVYTIKHLAFT